MQRAGVEARISPGSGLGHLCDVGIREEVGGRGRLAPALGCDGRAFS